jgi:glycerol-3-phosphate acyltransferase PlsY
MIAGFLLGSIPFAVLVGRLALGQDVRRFGPDGNPGAANAWRAGGWRLGLPVLALDFLKGALPVALARLLSGIDGWALLPIALAPILGHAFSPFLRLQGGKALAVTFGVWTGLRPEEGPLALGLLLAFFLIVLDNRAWIVIFGMLAFAVVLYLRGAGAPLLVAAALNLVILAWKHRRELRQTVRLNRYWAWMWRKSGWPGP